MPDQKEFQLLVQQLYATVDQLESLFPGRHFTPDGHMVGSIGECLVAEAYQLTLMTASNKGYDAVSQCGKRVEIKATQATSAAFRSEPEHTIVIQIKRDGTFDEIFNGPGDVVWNQFSDKPPPSNGQYQISLNKLRALQLTIDKSQQLCRHDLR